MIRVLTWWGSVWALLAVCAPAQAFGLDPSGDAIPSTQRAVAEETFAAPNPLVQDALAEAEAGTLEPATDASRRSPSFFLMPMGTDNDPGLGVGLFFRF